AGSAAGSITRNTAERRFWASRARSSSPTAARTGGPFATRSTRPPSPCATTSPDASARPWRRVPRNERRSHETDGYFRHRLRGARGEADQLRPRKDGGHVRRVDYDADGHQG